MERTRRNLLRTISMLAGVMMFPLRLVAAQWNEKAFDEVDFSNSLTSIGALAPVESDLITLKTPEIAENGSIDMPIAHHPRKKTKMVACESDERAHECCFYPLTHL